ncbi:siroheme synthase CysG [Gimibacter soli]|uniref:Siroheme synthase CysG n=1 Tax=Gimibacter soli TaxID=3024400 RepID=A0AAE9XLY7_9PROT|nr:siroheme synthase CysG [Gimibacter soli]WCL53367.1 siroheme synthase CysG [Gimibacter soli]
MQPETLFPISLDLRGRTCLMLGGGPIAATKAKPLLDAGATLRLVADHLCPDMAALIKDHPIEHAGALLDDPHLDGITLAIDSGEMPAFADDLRRMTLARGILLNAVDAPARCDFQMPAVVRRGPVQVAISTGGAAPTLARNLRQAIERLLPHDITHRVRRAAAIRVEVKEKLPPAAQRRLWDRMFDLGRLTDTEADMPDHLTEAEIEAAQGDGIPGEVWLVGAGAGSADMITLKGLKALESADVVLHDALIDPALLLHARRDARLIPVGKRCGKRSASQEFINRTLTNLAARGQRVVRLKCGDPFIFGRGGEELDHLQAAGIRTHIVPGVTAASVAAADCGIALTHRGISRRLTLMTASTNEGLAEDQPDWQALLNGGTVALYMARNKIGSLMEAMIASGVPAALPVMIIANAGRTERQQWQGTIGSMRAAPATLAEDAPTLIIVGASATARLAELHEPLAERTAANV